MNVRKHSGDFFDRQGPPTISSEGTDFNNNGNALSEFGQVIRVIAPSHLATLSPHPAAALFPVTTADVDRMAASLSRDGQQSPIVLSDEDKLEVLDGNIRRRAAIKIDMPLHAILFDPEAVNGLTLEEWVFRRNRAGRCGRHLNETQLAIIAVKAEAAIMRREAAARQNAGVHADGLKGESFARLAKRFEITPNRCRQAMKVFECGSERLLAFAFDGRTSLSKAAEIASWTSERQELAIRQIEDGLRPHFEIDDRQTAIREVIRARRKVESGDRAICALVQHAARLEPHAASWIDQVAGHLATAIDILRRIERESHG